MAHVELSLSELADSARPERANVRLPRALGDPWSGWPPSPASAARRRRASWSRPRRAAARCSASNGRRGRPAPRGRGAAPARLQRRCRGELRGWEVDMIPPLLAIKSGRSGPRPGAGVRRRRAGRSTVDAVSAPLRDAARSSARSPSSRRPLTAASGRQRSALCPVSRGV